MKTIFLLCLFSLGFNLYADNSESVYALDWKKDIVITAAAAGMFTYSYFLMEGNKGVLSNYDKNDLAFFDRELIFPINETLIDIRYVFMPTFVGLMALTPMTLGGGEMWKRFDTWFTYGTMFAQAWMLTYGVRAFFGHSTGRPRPANYYEDEKYNEYKNHDSFPSGTTALGFLPATFLSVTFSAEYPDSPMKIPVIIGSYTIATTIGALSLVSGQHFFSDVLAGAAIGSFFGWLIPTLHRRTDDRVSFFFTGNQAIVSVKF